MPGGSLQDHVKITTNETMTILRQCLSALEYLHSQDPPIAHRDIKPANILVKQRNETFIYVKLGDFGVSGDSSELMTMCGTQRYMAPEIYQEAQQRAGGKRKRGYNETVDVWSLGVVAYELMNGLPWYSSAYRKDGVAWCEAIVEKLQEDAPLYKDKLRRFLLGSILVISPTSRLSARDAYREAINLSSEGDETPSSGGSSLGSLFGSTEKDEEGTIVQRAPEDDTTSLLNPPTMVPGSTITTLSPLTQVPADGQELAYFVDNYSSNILNSLFVGSTLAELGEKEEETGFGSLIG
jgi:serine/threonine-protein kinase Chk2